MNPILRTFLFLGLLLILAIGLLSQPTTMPQNHTAFAHSEDSRSFQSALDRDCADNQPCGGDDHEPREPTPTRMPTPVPKAIQDKYVALGGEQSFLGLPINAESQTPDRLGRYRHYEHGSIYWSPSTGAYEVHGFIREKWASLGWEKSYLGYPTSDELATPDGNGRYSQFQNGIIYWTPQQGSLDAPKPIQNDQRSFEYLNVLSINLRSIYDVPSSGPRVQWRERFTRIARWMRDSGKTPDVMALQEAPGWWWCPTNWRASPDYSALHYLISRIKAETNLSYRIAYLVDTFEGGGLGGTGINGGTSATGCKLWGRQAMLYNVDRLRNVTAEPLPGAVVVEPQIPHDDLQKMGVHLRRSLPCCNPEDPAACRLVDDPKQTDKCSRETGAGLAWVATYHDPQLGRTALDVAFARFEVRRKPGQFVHLYNVHFGHQIEARQATRDLIQFLDKSRLANASRLFPPIVLGDFNGAWETFDDFEVAGWLSIDGVLIGKRDVFPSTYAAKWESLQLPSGDPCNGYQVLWSDHCAIYTHFESVYSRPETDVKDVVWVDDDVPAGATAAGYAEGWNWISNPTKYGKPFSGTRSHQSADVMGMHQHYFDGATSGLAVSAGDRLFAYVYLDPASIPYEVMLQWNDGSWEHRAYWGADLIGWGANGTDSRRYMGPIFIVGEWIRLEVPARLVGLEGHTLNGMAFTLFGGRATWDWAGKWDGTARLTVTKSLWPREDTGLFNLQIDGITRITGVGDRGSTGAIIVSPGVHSVSETAAMGTNLENYEVTFGGDCAPNGTVTVNPGENRRCVITNTLRSAATARAACFRACEDQLDSCMESVGTPGGPLPRDCVRESGVCRAGCFP